MKKISLLFLVFLFAAGMTFATEHKTSKSEQIIKGTLEKIDLQGKTITLKQEKQTQSRDINYSDNATFWTKGKAMKADQLQPGEKVTVYLDSTSNLAMKIYVDTTHMSSTKDKNYHSY
jgi:Cu/Ag efflux protein CusF